MQQRSLQQKGEIYVHYDLRDYDFVYKTFYFLSQMSTFVVINIMVLSYIGQRPNLKFCGLYHPQEENFHGSK